MFEALISLENLKVSTETLSPEQITKKREFLESRILRRWNFNKNSPSKASLQLQALQSSFNKIQKRIVHKKINKNALMSNKIDIKMVNSTVMLAGLRQISELAKVFEEICSKPPSDEQTNLIKFKMAMVRSLKAHAPAYSYKGYRVCANFMIDKHLIKTKLSLTNLGYDESFFSVVEKALEDTQKLIDTMKDHEELIHKLGVEIVDVLMGPKAADYIHARRGYELVNTVFTSILTLAWPQYLTMAISISGKISNCYS